MDNGDQIQQTNLVSDDTAAAMDGASADTGQPVASPAPMQPQIDPMPVGSAADPIAPPTPAFSVPTSDPLNTPPAPAPVSAPTPTPEPATLDPAPFTATTINDTAVTDASHDELDDIKRNALEELKPLIEHIEQSPEERFETVMMMIRSNDDPKLISSAYEAAKGIDDEKKRASAFLNIVSEIEYLKSKS